MSYALQRIEDRVTERDRLARVETALLPHLDAAYNLARWLTRNDHDAQDVVQEAALRAFRFFDGLRGAPRPWLLAIVRNSCMSWMQINRPAELAAFDDGALERIADDAGTPEDLALRGVDRRRLNEALAALPAPFREAIVLRELEDLAYKDIARIAEIPIGTVMSRLARGRTRLIKLIACGTRRDAAAPRAAP